MTPQQRMNGEILGRLFGLTPSEETKQLWLDWKDGRPWNVTAWCAGIDLTGISCVGQNMALIAPRTVVWANHTQNQGAPVYFAGKDGVRHERRLVKNAYMGVDTCVSLLDSPLPKTVTPFRLPPMNLGWERCLLLATNRYKWAGLEWGGAWQPSALQLAGLGVEFPPDWNLFHWRTFPEGGDSGATIGPIIDGEFLLGTFYSTTTAGPNMGRLASRVNTAIINDLGGDPKTDTAEVWQPYSVTDVNRDGMTDSVDINVLAANWQKQTRR
jgi:hypothetical protein